MARPAVPPTPPPTQRAGVFALLPALLEELGIAPGVVFGGSFIDPATLEPGTAVPLDRLLAVMDRAARLCGREDIGLLLGGRFTLEVHGVLGRLMRCAPTLGHALLDFVRWQPAYSSAAVVYLVPFGQDMAWGYALESSGQPGVRQVQDTVAAVALRMVRALTGGAVAPMEVLLSHGRPRDTGAYEALRVPVRFDQPQSCVVVEARLMARVLPGADAARHAALASEMALAMRPAAFVARVRRELRPAIYRGEPGMAAVAQALGLTARTLRRRLAEEGVVFSALRDEVRLTMAQELLRLTGLPVGDIALALGFASHGAFIAAFRRWTGTTPSGWRLVSCSIRRVDHPPAARE